MPAMSITASAAAPTQVYVGGTNVIDGNNVTYWLNDDSSGGIRTGAIDNYNVKYDPTTGTLTLSGAAISGNAQYERNSTDYCAIFADGGTLNIVLNGENIVEVGGSEAGDNIAAFAAVSAL